MILDKDHNTKYIDDLHIKDYLDNNTISHRCIDYSDPLNIKDKTTFSLLTTYVCKLTDGTTKNIQLEWSINIPSEHVKEGSGLVSMFVIEDEYWKQLIQTMGLHRYDIMNAIEKALDNMRFK